MANAVGGEDAKDDGEEDESKMGREQMEVGRIVEVEREARKDGANRRDNEERTHENMATQDLPWKIIYQNIRRLITNNKKIK